MHDPIQSPPSVSGDAVKTDPAPLKEISPPAGGAGEVIVGRTPWRYETCAYCNEVRDRDGKLVAVTPSPFIAARIITAVNAWTKLFGDNCHHRDVLRALHVQLLPLRAMPAIKRALDLIERTLHPETDSLP